MRARLLPPLAAFLIALAIALPAPSSSAQEPPVPAYLALGDSLAFGVGAENPAAQGYVGLVAFELEQTEEYAETGLEVVNVSVPGATSSDLVEEGGQLDQALEAIEEREETEGLAAVDLITISVGANDLLALGEPESDCFVDPLGDPCQEALAATLAGLNENLAHVLTTLRAAAPLAEVYVLDVYNPYSGTDDPLEIVASVGVQQINGVITAVAADPTYRSELVSVFELFQGRGNQLIASDGIHPNNDGYLVMAEAVLSTIQDRPFVFPPDISPVPSGSVSPTPVDNGGDSGVDAVVFWITLPLAFAAGVVLTGAYFLMRGRRGLGSS